MKRFLTPFFILTLVTIGYCIYIWFADETGWGIFTTVYLGAFAIIIFIIDFALKKAITNLWKIALIEMLLLGILALTIGYQKRVKNLIINDNFKKKYICVIYGVENEKELSITPLTWTKDIDIPDNGILLTSSNISYDLPKTNIKYKSGNFVTSKESNKGFIELPESEFEFNRKVYKYRRWKIQEGSCCSWSSLECDSLDTVLKNEFEKLKAHR